MIVTVIAFEATAEGEHVTAMRFDYVKERVGGWPKNQWPKRAKLPVTGLPPIYDPD